MGDLLESVGQRVDLQGKKPKTKLKLIWTEFFTDTSSMRFLHLD